MQIRFDCATSFAALLFPLACAKTPSSTATIAHEHAPSVSTTTSVWYCPMHPSYRSDRPGHCPICQMDLLPLDPEATASIPPTTGRAAVSISPERVQLIGVRTTCVERADFQRTLRAAGIVATDETKLSAVSLKFGGWIEELYLKSVGDAVKPGDPLLAIWSPELYEAQKSYLITRSLRKDERGADAESIEIARKKLVLWDMTADEIAELEKKSDPDKRSIVVSKTRGVVTRRDAVVGNFVEPGKTLYEIADLGSVWVEAEVYESERSLVRVGQEASIDVASERGKARTGRVVLVHPMLDPATRTVRLRIAVDNADGALAPGMFATVSLAVDLGDQLSIDDDAVIDTGIRRLVFVEKGAGRFEPREVSLGARTGGRAVVVKGLEAGERVVSSASFLVDSESRLRAALLQHAPEDRAPAAHARP